LRKQRNGVCNTHLIHTTGFNLSREGLTTDYTETTDNTDISIFDSNESNGVCNTPKNDSYTWSEAERVVGQEKIPRVCNTRHYKR